MIINLFYRNPNQLIVFIELRIPSQSSDVHNKSVDKNTRIEYKIFNILKINEYFYLNYDAHGV